MRKNVRRSLALAALVVLQAAPFSLGAGCDDGCSKDDSECDGNKILRCYQGDLSSSTNWGVEKFCKGTCVELPPGPQQSPRPICALSSEPDPRCEPHGEGCDGKSVIFCREGFLTGIFSCPDDFPVCVKDEHWPCSGGGCSSRFSFACASEQDPDPRCTGKTGSFCIGNSIATCDRGVLSTQSCDWYVGDDGALLTIPHLYECRESGSGASCVNP